MLCYSFHRYTVVQLNCKSDQLNTRLIALFLLITSVHNSTALHAQNKYKVSNASTGEAIPYATIKILHTEKRAYSDERGEFQLAIAPDDSILVTSIGFTPTVFVIRDHKLPVFRLVPVSQELQKVVVKNKKLYKKHTLGNINLTQDGYWYFFGKGEEIAQLVNFPLEDDNIFKIKKVIIPIELSKTSIPILLHIYSVNDSGRPEPNYCRTLTC